MNCQPNEGKSFHYVVIDQAILQTASCTFHRMTGWKGPGGIFGSTFLDESTV